MTTGWARGRSIPCHGYLATEAFNLYSQTAFVTGSFRCSGILTFSSRRLSIAPTGRSTALLTGPLMYLSALKMRHARARHPGAPRRGNRPEALQPVNIFPGPDENIAVGVLCTSVTKMEEGT